MEAIEKEEKLFYDIALTQTENIGDKTARQLLHHFENAKSIFNASPRRVAAIDGLSVKKIEALKKAIDEKAIRKELAFINKYGIKPLLITDNEYPSNLKSCPDAPILLYYRGNINLNELRLVSVIGTRKNTDYGVQVTHALLEGLQGYNIAIVSGLAYGIDIVAHRKALQLGIPTLGVLAHGMDTIYPTQHKYVAKEMTLNGGLLTEYPSGTGPDRFHFPMRNRIVAGMCDVTVVVETERQGGAMITAKLASGYNREVAAFPGRTTDKKSDGCNYLLGTNIAQLITGPEDLIEMMGWDRPAPKPALQRRLFPHLNSEELCVATSLEQADNMHIDELCLKTGIPASSLSLLLLNLELSGVVHPLAGKRYRLA
ncbi:DNA-processing protein DprA [Taibaiella koreensis]|uniref:DNA-processing protein DprA n=1 Tax=Taibaiella koreensis TaxID=1268548 RepID=UPI000E59F6C6|nr:DNA-processing protein DprA [Taibaiella koreensis]